MKIQGNEIKPGMIIEFNNDHWTVLKAQHVKPGKGGAFNQLELKSLTKGTKLNQRFRSSESVERAQLEEKEFNFLYSKDEESFFMEPKTFEQISINSNLLGDKSKLLTENLKVIISFLDEKPLSIDLPNNIECVVENTEGVVKGQTAASSYKPAILKGGIKTSVPPFISIEDHVVISTADSSYIEKAKK